MSRANIVAAGSGFIVCESRNGEQSAYEYSEEDFARIQNGADPAHFQATRVEPAAAMIAIMADKAADIEELL